MEQTVCSETSAFKTQTPGNYPKEIIQHSKQGEILKSRIKKSSHAIFITENVAYFIAIYLHTAAVVLNKPLRLLYWYELTIGLISRPPLKIYCSFKKHVDSKKAYCRSH
jgi:hypothetical protein